MRATLRLILRKQTAIMIALVISITTLSSLTPVARYLNEGFLDIALRTLTSDGKSDALLLTYLPGHLDSDELLPLIDALFEQGALAVTLPSMPLSLTDEAVEAIKTRGVLLGAPVAQILDLEPDKRQFWAANDVPSPGDENKYRPWLNRNGAPIASLAVKTAGLVMPDSNAIPLDPFYINYNRIGTLPELTVIQASSGSLIPELVKGSIVYIGPGGRQDLVTLKTPLGAISAAAYHAYAAESITKSMAIHPLTPISSLLFIFAASVLTLCAFLTTRRYLGVSAAIGVVVYVAVWMFATRSGLILPLVEIFAAMALSSYLIIRTVRLEQRQALREIIAEHRQKFQERMSNRGFLEQEEHWQQILNMVNQALNLDRVLFLQRDPDEHRVHEIVAHNCRFDDIAESRRDYDREPYRTAIATRSPVELEKPYLSQLDNDKQFLVALSVGGEVLGFWALSAAADKITDKRQFLEALGGFADQISELLQLKNAYHRDELMTEKSSSVANLGATDLLRELLTSSDRRLTVFEAAFDSQSTATIVYDLFGNVVQMNRMMGEVLSRIGFAAYNATALDFLVKMTGQEQDMCRSLLRYVILNRQRVTVPLAQNFTDELGQDFLVSLGPINPRVNEVDTRLIRISGLMIEMQDISAVQHESRLKQDIIERLGYRLRGDAESMVLASSLLEEDDLDDETQKEFIGLLVDKVNSATAVLEEVRSHLESTSVASAGEACPVDSVTILKRVIAQAEARVSAKQLTLETSFPQVGNLVIAETEALEDFFTAAVELLIQDAADASVLTFDVVDQPDHQQLTLRNEGFGIPRERFLHYLDDPQSAAGPEFEKLRFGKSRVESWGGTFASDSKIGKGFEFEIFLRTIF